MMPSEAAPNASSSVSNGTVPGSCQSVEAHGANAGVNDRSEKRT